MNENIKEIVNIIGNAELSNKCHKECFINTDFDNECTLCRQATTLDKAGYRKQSDTVKEFAEKVLKDISDSINHNARIMESSRNLNLASYHNALITNNACKGIYDAVTAIVKEYGVEE